MSTPPDLAPIAEGNPRYLDELAAVLARAGITGQLLRPPRGNLNS